MMLLVAASLLLNTPAPLDLPRAEAYLVKEDGVRRLEDRYNVFDLWLYRTVIGRWYDDEGRTFVLSKLDTLPPAMEDAETETREDYVAGEVRADKKEKKHLRRMVENLSPVEVAEDWRGPRQLPRGFKDVRYCHGTNTAVIVCAFLPEKSPCWYLATWELAERDVYDDKLAEFEKWLTDEVKDRRFEVKGQGSEVKGQKPEVKAVGERDLLRKDVKHGVEAYENWHFTDSQDFVVVDDLSSRKFVESLTNDVPAWRAEFARVMPTPIDGTNTLAVARIYENREDYLDAAGEDMEWSAAYWSPMRRELVACLPEDGTEKLRKTIHHESFHQYLSYALAMMSASPWLNEGYAQYFEDVKSRNWELGDVNISIQDIDNMGEMIPGIMMMDYKQFYGGTSRERRMKYRLAWSIAVFIEHGAPLVRFQPFKDLKRDYVEYLLNGDNMRDATFAAFGTKDKLDLFVLEWKRFWKNQ